MNTYKFRYTYEKEIEAENLEEAQDIAMEDEDVGDLISEIVEEDGVIVESVEY